MDFMSAFFAKPVEDRRTPCSGSVERRELKTFAEADSKALFEAV
jgi:hypothetical protein